MAQNGEVLRRVNQALRAWSSLMVTSDALSCQREIAQQVIDQKADYVMTLKPYG